MKRKYFAVCNQENFLGEFDTLKDAKNWIKDNIDIQDLKEIVIQVEIETYDNVYSETDIINIYEYNQEKKRFIKI